jgi:peptidoglycan/xylan/chitin deacetylase (PgdA/CDA1 family)/glycosyltransferase involved in cell wall biosynthesis
MNHAQSISVASDHGSRYLCPMSSFASKFAKPAVLRMARRIGAFRLVGQSAWRSDRLVILCYHGISLADEHEWQPRLYLSQETFRRRMQIVADLGYRVLPLAEALQRLASNDLPPRSLAITFDDGFCDFHQRALPVLKQFSFPATVYLTSFYSGREWPVFDVIVPYLLWRRRGIRLEGLSDHLGEALDLRSAESRDLCWQKIKRYAADHHLNAGQKDRLAADLANAVAEDYRDLRGRRLLQIMNSKELAEIAAAGMDIQLHTHRHRAPRDRQLFIREVEENRQFIRDITGRAPVHFCYPSGVCFPELFPWLTECGVESATTCELDIVSKATPALAIPRILDSERISDAEFESWISGFRPLLSSTKAQHCDHRTHQVQAVSQSLLDAAGEREGGNRTSCSLLPKLAPNQQERNLVSPQAADSPRGLSLLVISYYFPPNPAVGGRRVARFCNYLPEFGIRPIVLTVDEQSCPSIDRSFKPSAELPIEHARPGLTALDWYRRWSQARERHNAASASASDANPGAQPGRKLAGLRHNLIALLDFPDACRGWYLPATRAAKRIIETSQVDAVFSSGPPWTSHLIAHKISRRYDLPWIADFRDAWASDSWRKHEYRNQGVPEWRSRLDFRVEDRWLHNAKLVLCTTDWQRQDFLQSHSGIDSAKVITISNGLDPRSGRPMEPARSKNGRRVLLHAGELYGGRRVDTFCQALAILVHNRRLSCDDVKVTLLGAVDPDIERDSRSAAPDLFVNGMIEFQPPVSWESALKATNAADVLLIFQGDHSAAIPAKFFEYLQTGKPVLAIVGDGALKDMVLDTGAGVVADPRDPAVIAAAIEAVLRARPRSAEEIAKIASQFDSRKLTAKLAERIREVV